MKQRLVLLAFLAISLGQVLAQEIKIIDPRYPHEQRLPLTNEQFFEQAEFIFEGRLIAKSEKSYDILGDLSGKGFYTSSIIEIKHIYKGGNKIKRGTIEIITKGGTIKTPNQFGLYDGESYYPDGFVGVGTGNDAIFFCKVSEFPKNPNTRVFDNTISVSHLVNREYAALTIGSIRYGYKDYKNRIIGLNYLNFVNRDEFNQYLKQFKGLNIPEKNDKINNGGCSIEKFKEQKGLLKAFMQKQEQLTINTKNHFLI